MCYLIIAMGFYHFVFLLLIQLCYFPLKPSCLLFFSALQWLWTVGSYGQSCGVRRQGWVLETVASQLLCVQRVWRASGGPDLFLEGRSAAVWTPLLPEHQTSLPGLWWGKINCFLKHIFTKRYKEINQTFRKLSQQGITRKSTFGYIFFTLRCVCEINTN